ncbi:GNAT family N-acetyltransferase [Jeotgalibacillus sp. S-D1]|uniref:GNAT family N-acetyltransferase n=1 Tax=Jeotgalibacillus sp. S-D1 TaxID=2552189 RepID=UPI00105A9891|nr:GNAT family N-acetyltransferase [Jeotgalibacillus sp. S-D1]TDL31392.1 GNAT family N-acetyltransferase [Jeotgalibacillus sp. S-D1]
MHIFEGEVTFQPTKTIQSFTVRKLESQDEKSYLQLQDEIVNGLGDPETLQPLTTEELRYIFEGGGIILGVFVEEVLIAARALLYPGDDPENVGHDLELSFEEQMKVVHQEITLVKEEYRGNGLQKTLSKIIMQQLRHSSNYFVHLCSTVSPKNIPSLKDKFNQGLVIVDVKEKYEGSLRYIFYQHLVQNIKIESSSLVYIRIDKVDRHKDFLDSGYVGVGIDQTKLGVWIAFGRVVEK